MRDLTVLAEQIRAVRDAEKRFMSLWRVEQVLVGPEVLDRLERDLAEVAQLADDVLSLSRGAAAGDPDRHGADADRHGADADRHGADADPEESYRPEGGWPMNGGERGLDGSDLGRSDRGTSDRWA